MTATRSQLFPVRAGDRRVIGCVCFLLVLAVFVVFGQTVRYDFVNLDDGDYFFSNPRVKAGLTWDGMAWAFGTGCASNWHPLTWLSLKPDYADAHGNLANVLTVQGKLDEAVRECQMTLTLLPSSAQAHFRLGQALEKQNKFAAAVAEYEKPLELDPRHVPAQLALAWLWATCPEASLRNGKQAVALAEQARTLAGIESPTAGYPGSGLCRGRAI